MKTLFDWNHFVTRTSDPETSRLAEEQITKDGSRARACAEALALVQAQPGWTANEYEAFIGVSDGRIRKRLTDLEKLGLVRRGEARTSAITRKLNQTWWPVTWGKGNERAEAESATS